MSPNTQNTTRKPTASTVLASIYDHERNRMPLTACTSTAKYTRVVSNHRNTKPANVDIECISYDTKGDCNCELEEDPWHLLLSSLLAPLHRAGDCFFDNSAACMFFLAAFVFMLGHRIRTLFRLSRGYTSERFRGLRPKQRLGDRGEHAQARHPPSPIVLHT